jgi:hypothetical protein
MTINQDTQSSAIRPRRGRRGAVGSAVTAAALAVAVSMTLTGCESGFHRTSNAELGDAPAADSAVRLVSYTGQQPRGFTIDKVPDGWFIQMSDPYGLVMAPNTARNPGPDVNPSAAPLYDPRRFDGKIAITLQSKDATLPKGAPRFAWNDYSGVLADDKGTDGATVWVKQPDGVYLLAQFWPGLGFSDQQMIELATGVHVLQGAEQGVG